MKRIVTALALALATVVAVPAFAGEHGAADGNGAAAFPMKADAFQQKVEARIARVKAKVEKRIVDKKLDAAKAKEVRDRVDARVQKIRAAAADAEKDGVVTKDEAHAVHKAGGHGRHHKNRGAGNGNSGK